MSFLSHNAAIPGTVRGHAMTFLRALWFVFLLAVPRAALAAGTVSIGTLVQWVDKSGTVLTRDVNNQKTATLGDCNSDYALQFPLTFSNDFGPPTSAEVWVGSTGADCTQINSRQGNAPTCWRVSREALVRPASGAPLSVNVRVADVMSQAPNATGAYVAAAAGSCKALPLAALTIYFMSFESSTSYVVGGSYALSIDTEGPTPPSNLNAEVGNSRLYLTFTPPTLAGQNIAFTDVYCAISPAAGTLSVDAGTSSPADSGTTSDAGSDADTTDAGVVDEDSGVPDAAIVAPDATVAADATTSGTDAASSVSASGLNCALNTALVSGKQMSAKLPDGVWLCAHETASSSLVPSSVTVTKGPGDTTLVNGTNYTMAVAFVDTVGNVGVLSEAVCATPEMTVGFYDQYVNAGGEASGCALSPGGGGSLAGVVLLGLVLAAVWRSR